MNQPHRIRLRNNGEFTSPGYRRARNLRFVVREVTEPSTETLTVPSVDQLRVELLDTARNYRCRIPYRFLSHTACLKLDLNPFWKAIPFEEKRGGTLCPIVLALAYSAQPPVYASVLVEWIGCRRRVGRHSLKTAIAKENAQCPRTLRREALLHGAVSRIPVSPIPPWPLPLPILPSPPGLSA